MFFELIRSALCPFDQIEAYVPKKGKILDLGCGHGIFSRLLMKKSPSRRVLGIDPSMHKINIARKKAIGIKNIKFQKGVLDDINKVKFDCITIIDVLYLLSPSEKTILLSKVKKLLKPKGYLVLTEVSSKPSFLYDLIKLEEYIMVKILRYTYSNGKKLYFQSDNHYLKLFKRIGFKKIRFKKIQGLSPYPKHILFMGFNS